MVETAPTCVCAPPFCRDPTKRGGRGGGRGGGKCRETTVMRSAPLRMHARKHARTHAHAHARMRARTRTHAHTHRTIGTHRPRGLLRRGSTSADLIRCAGNSGDLLVLSAALSRVRVVCVTRRRVTRDGSPGSRRGERRQRWARRVAPRTGFEALGLVACRLYLLQLTRYVYTTVSFGDRSAGEPPEKVGPPAGPSDCKAVPGRLRTRRL